MHKVIDIRGPVHLSTDQRASSNVKAASEVDQETNDASMMLVSGSELTNGGVISSVDFEINDNESEYSELDAPEQSPAPVDATTHKFEATGRDGTVTQTSSATPQTTGGQRQEQCHAHGRGYERGYERGRGRGKGRGYGRGYGRGRGYARGYDQGQPREYGRWYDQGVRFTNKHASDQHSPNRDDAPREVAESQTTLDVHTTNASANTVKPGEVCGPANNNSERVAETSAAARDPRGLAGEGGESLRQPSAGCASHANNFVDGGNSSWDNHLLYAHHSHANCRNMQMYEHPGMHLTNNVASQRSNYFNGRVTYAPSEQTYRNNEHFYRSHHHPDFEHDRRFNTQGTFYPSFAQNVANAPPRSSDTSGTSSQRYINDDQYAAGPASFETNGRTRADTNGRQYDANRYVARRFEPGSDGSSRKSPSQRRGRLGMSEVRKFEVLAGQRETTEGQLAPVNLTIGNAESSTASKLRSDVPQPGPVTDLISPASDLPSPANAELPGPVVFVDDCPVEGGNRRHSTQSTVFRRFPVYCTFCKTATHTVTKCRRWKTSICRHWYVNNCRFAEQIYKCPYAHGDWDLRTTVK